MAPKRSNCYAWQQLQRLKRQFLRAHERGWRLAEKALFRDFGDTLLRVQYELEGAARRVEAHRKPRQAVSSAEIYRDILALGHE
jgi:hypothetical protein